MKSQYEKAVKNFQSLHVGAKVIFKEKGREFPGIVSIASFSEGKFNPKGFFKGNESEFLTVYSTDETYNRGTPIFHLEDSARIKKAQKNKLTEKARDLFKSKMEWIPKMPTTLAGKLAWGTGALTVAGLVLNLYTAKPDQTKFSETLKNFENQPSIKQAYEKASEIINNYLF